MRLLYFVAVLLVTGIAWNTGAPSPNPHSTSVGQYWCHRVRQRAGRNVWLRNCSADNLTTRTSVPALPSHDRDTHGGSHFHRDAATAIYGWNNAGLWRGRRPALHPQLVPPHLPYGAIPTFLLLSHSKIIHTWILPGSLLALLLLTKFCKNIILCLR